MYVKQLPMMACLRYDLRKAFVESSVSLTIKLRFSRTPCLITLVLAAFVDPTARTLLQNIKPGVGI